MGRYENVITFTSGATGRRLFDFSFGVSVDRHGGFGKVAIRNSQNFRAGMQFLASRPDLLTHYLNTRLNIAESQCLLKTSYHFSNQMNGLCARASAAALLRHSGG
jgi:hypothetical protein